MRISQLEAGKMDQQIDNRNCASPFVEAAVRIAQAIDGSEARNEILSSGATIYLDSDQRDLALNLAETIDDGYQRDLTLTRIAAASVAAGEGDQAESILDLIEDDAAYALAIEQSAAAYTRSGEIEKATELAGRLSDSDSALSSIALACPSADLLTDCIDIAREIDYSELEAMTLAGLAARARELEARTESAELIEEAVAAAHVIDFPPQRIQARMAIAARYREDDQPEEAARVLVQIHGDCSELEGLDRDAALEQIAVAYAELREFTKAEQLLEEIEDPFQFSIAAALVALEQYEAGDEAAAIKLLADGLEVARDEQVYGPQTLVSHEAAFGQLARTYAAIGLIEDALRVIESLASEEQQDANLKEIAAMPVVTQNSNVAFKLFEKIKDDFMRVVSEVDVARAWARTDQPALADHLLTQATAQLSKIELPYRRVICLADLAGVYELREQTARAHEHLFDALKTTESIEGNYHRALGLLVLAVRHKELNWPASEQELQVLEAMINRLD